MSTNTELVAELYASDAASALTNRAGRAIEDLEAEVERLTALYENSTAAHEETVGRAMRAEAQLAAAQRAPLTPEYHCVGYIDGYAHAISPSNIGLRIPRAVYVIAAPIPQQPAEPQAGIAYQGRWFDLSDDKEGWSDWRGIDPIDLPRWREKATKHPDVYEIRALVVASAAQQPAAAPKMVTPYITQEQFDRVFPAAQSQSVLHASAGQSTRMGIATTAEHRTRKPPHNQRT